MSLPGSILRPNWARLLTLAGLVAVLVSVSCEQTHNSTIRYVRADELRDHSGKCFDASRCSLKSIGDEWTVHSDCERATCVRATNGTMLEKRMRCNDPTPVASEACYVVRVEGRPFPQCCPKLYCNNKPVTPDRVK